MTGMTYAQTGVDYDVLDAFKRIAQQAARETAGNIRRLADGEFRELEMSRGESAYLIETPDCYLAHVEEGLGTKNLIADAMYRRTGKSYYDCVAQDTVAAIVNDMVTLGALPLSVAMHVAAGDSDWFEDERRSRDLVEGWKEACHAARCSWGGGETPTLKDVVISAAISLSGSAVGVVKPKSRLIRPEKIQDGDAIVLIESSGIHANGLTMARAIAAKLPRGYLTELSDGRMYGEALLAPTLIYVGLIEDCLVAGIDIHGAVHLTGHGWRKLMRAPQPLTYVIERLPRQQPIFSFLEEYGPVGDREAYANFNMGAGFALYVPEGDAVKMSALCRRTNMPYTLVHAGRVEKGERRVVIRPKNLEYRAQTLQIR